ncbi:MAG: hypothetical protein SVW77_00250 [Candidatus Nanohaloarchaea archaeon]|nr:hypothetical protein [Candidatus Nanohaloarchaea archaeon]
MVADTFIALFGLATTLTVHTYFYLTAYSKDSGFTGLLQTEERMLMDSMLVIGALQVLYFLWRYLQATFPTAGTGGAAAVALIGLALLALFFYHSHRLVDNMQEIYEKYGFEVDLT